MATNWKESPLRRAKRTYELVVRDRVISALKAEGRTITDIREPDRLERQQRAPDFDFLLDGERVGLEVTEFALPVQEEQARAGAGRVAALISAQLSPLATSLGLGLVVVGLSYIVGEVPTKRRAQTESAALLAAIETAMRRCAAEGIDRVDLGAPVPWVHPDVAVRIASRDSIRPRVTVVHGRRGGRQITPVVEVFLADRAASKGAQTAGYGRAILGVLRGWVADPEDFDLALEKAQNLPWWRIYVTDRGKAAVLVYEAPDADEDLGAEAY